MKLDLRELDAWELVRESNLESSVMKFDIESLVLEHEIES